jgi:hypothetical protein
MKFWARSLGRTIWLCALLVSASCTRTPSLETFGLLPRRELSPLSWSNEHLSLGHLQLKGTHNSYHQAPRFALSRQWRNSQAPLDVQLDTQGVRQLELDLRYDQGSLLVGHLPIVDGRTTCRTFRSCLFLIKSWSKKRPGHLPVFVFIEAKDALAPSRLDGRIDAIESAIAATFPRSLLLTPGDVAQPGLSLRDSVQAHGWPSLGEARGKVAFVLFGHRRHRHAYWKANRAGLDGLMFVAVKPGESHRPEAAVLMIDDPIRYRALIDGAAKSGFLVRTRADKGLVRDVARRDAALRSGAHFISTDFADPQIGWLDIGERTPVRCNPISAPTGCRSHQLAALERSGWLFAALPSAAELPTSGL